MIEAQFGVCFPPELANRVDIGITTYRREDEKAEHLLYLAHMGYELPLMLDGRKKLAKMYHEYPPQSFADEKCFDK